MEIVFAYLIFLGLANVNKIEDENIDNIHFDGITKDISNEKIHIKSNLFLDIYQIEKFDSDAKLY